MSKHPSRSLFARGCLARSATAAVSVGFSFPLAPSCLSVSTCSTINAARHVCAAVALHHAVNQSSELAVANPLFQPIVLGGYMHLPNRFCMQPMYLNMESELTLESAEHMQALATFYAERAHYGAKLIILGGLGTSRWGRWHKNALMLTTHDSAHALRRVTDAVHQEGGYILAQAFHAGRAARKRWFLSATNEPSLVQPFRQSHPYRIPACAVDYVVSEYERLACLAQEAGFDGLEIPVSEGSLLHNFFSPAVNHRHDRFGGSLPKRMEMVIRVLERVHAALSSTSASLSLSSWLSCCTSCLLPRHMKRQQQKPHQLQHEEQPSPVPPPPLKRFVLSLRLCVHDLKPNGSTTSDTLLAAELLAQSGYLHLLNTSVGMHDSPVQTLSSCVPQASFARCCARLRRHLRQRQLDIPIVASHRIHSMGVAERLVRGEVCDLVGLARPLLADAQCIAKTQANRVQEILPCIACNHCVNRLYKCQRVGCALNPIAGYELERACRPARHPRRIAVIGAGPAGLTCALTLWRRGHAVSLFERDRHVGGQLNLAKLIPGKESYQEILEYWTRALRGSSIALHMGSEFTREDVSRQHQRFDAVVLTVGGLARPVSSHFIAGASESPMVVTYEAILSGRVRAGRRVVIVGHGAIGYDIASYLLHDPRVSREAACYLEEWGVDVESGSLGQTDACATDDGKDHHCVDARLSHARHTVQYRRGDDACDGDSSDRRGDSTHDDTHSMRDDGGHVGRQETSWAHTGQRIVNMATDTVTPCCAKQGGQRRDMGHCGRAEDATCPTRRTPREGCARWSACGQRRQPHSPRNNRDVILVDAWNKDADLSWGKGWSQKLWIRRHGGTIIKHGMVNMIDATGVHINTIPPHAQNFYVPCDTVVWCCGVLPNISLGTWIFEWAKDGAMRRGEMNTDFAIYTAGACRDSMTGDGNGEEDLLQAVHEGYEIGYKI